MKTVFTLLLALFATSAFAYDEGRLTFTIADRNNVQVIIDNRSYAVTQEGLDFSRVTPGQHSVRIVRGRSTGNRRNSSRTEVLYAANIYMKPLTHIDIVVNRFGRVYVDEQALNGTQDPYGGNYGNGNYGNGNYGNTGYNQAMSDNDFALLYQRVKGQWTSGQKLSAAKDAVPYQYFSTQQVRQLVQLFTFDSEKLELAKLAYGRTVDTRNYYLVKDLFQFQATKDELEEYIRYR
jgi:hypothetical protein